MNLKGLNLTPDQLDAFEKLAGFNLQVPESAVRDRKGVARWTEEVIVETTTSKDEIGTEGQERSVLSIKLKVLPGSNGDLNAGRVFTSFQRLNPKVMNGDSEGAGQGSAQSELTMSALSLKRVRGFLAAAVVDLSEGVTGDLLEDLFVEADPKALTPPISPLAGRRIGVLIADNERKQSPSGENAQEIEAFLGVN